MRHPLTVLSMLKPAPMDGPVPVPPRRARAFVATALLAGAAVVTLLPRAANACEPQEERRLLVPFSDAPLPTNAALWLRGDGAFADGVMLIEVDTDEAWPLTRTDFGPDLIRLQPDPLYPETTYRVDTGERRLNVIFQTSAFDEYEPPYASGVFVGANDDCPTRVGTMNVDRLAAAGFVMVREPGDATTIDALDFSTVHHIDAAAFTLGPGPLPAWDLSFVDAAGNVSATVSLQETAWTCQRWNCAQSGPADASFLIAWLVLLASRLRRRRSGAQ